MNDMNSNSKYHKKNRWMPLAAAAAVFIFMMAGCGEALLQTDKTPLFKNTLDAGWNYIKTNQPNTALLRFKELLLKINETAHLQEEEKSARTGCGWAYLMLGAKDLASEEFERVKDSSNDANIGYAIMLLLKFNGKAPTNDERQKAKKLIESLRLSKSDKDYKYDDYKVSFSFGDFASGYCKQLATITSTEINSLYDYFYLAEYASENKVSTMGLSDINQVYEAACDSKKCVTKVAVEKSSDEDILNIGITIE